MPNRTAGREKDRRLYDEAPGVHGLEGFVEQGRAGWSEGAALGPDEVDVVVALLRQ